MRRLSLIILWLITDLALFIGAYALAYVLRVGWILSSDFPFDRFLLTVLIVSPLWLGVMMQFGVFRLTRMQAAVRNMLHIVFAGIVGSALFSLTYYFLHDAFFSRLLLIYAFALSAVATTMWHIVYEQIMRRALRSGSPVFPTLIVGATREAEELIHVLNKRKSPLAPVAILDGRGAKQKEIDGVPVLGKLNKLEEVLHEHHISHLIQCSDLEQTLNLLSACRSNNITYILLPSVLGIVERDERIELLEGRTVTMVRPHEPWWTWFFR